MYAVLKGKAVRTWAHGHLQNLPAFRQGRIGGIVQPKPETMQYILTSISRIGKAFELSVFAELIHKLVYGLEERRRGGDFYSNCGIFMRIVTAKFDSQILK